MFDKFGEFDSAEELNRAAAGFRAEGDLESLRALAEENGIDAEDAQDYIDGATGELAGACSAAVGRLAILLREETERAAPGEAQALRLIHGMAAGMALEETDLCEGMMRRGNRLRAVYEALREGARTHQSGGMGVACGTDRQLRGIIRTYFGGGDVEDAVQALYR